MALSKALNAFFQRQMEKVTDAVNEALNPQSLGLDAGDFGLLNDMARCSIICPKFSALTEVLRWIVEDAQVWAREAEATFEETLAAVRYAAGEQLTVQGKRLRAWEEALAAQAASRSPPPSSL